MFRFVPKGLAPPSDRASARVAKAAALVAFAVPRSTIFHTRKGGYGYV